MPAFCVQGSCKSVGFQNLQRSLRSSPTLYELKKDKEHVSQEGQGIVKLGDVMSQKDGNDKGMAKLESQVEFTHELN